jgi:quercetin dioxygenase-like cupin family protein
MPNADATPVGLAAAASGPTIAHEPRRAAGVAVGARPDRPATAVLHDSDDARLVVFRIAPGQAVPPHRSPSTVLLQVVDGAGMFTGEGGDLPVGTGDVVVYAPHALHGMHAAAEARTMFVVLATIAPRPGRRPPSAVTRSAAPAASRIGSPAG